MSEELNRLKPLKEAGAKLLNALANLVNSEYAYEMKPFELPLGDNIKIDKKEYDAALNEYNEATKQYDLILAEVRRTSENKPE